MNFILKTAIFGLLFAFMIGSSFVLAEESGTAHSNPSIDEGAAKILGLALTHSQAWDQLEYLSDRIGHRLSGSPALDKAIAWSTQQLQAAGLEVWNEPVMVPHWVRGDARAKIVEPVVSEMALLALGGSVPTPAGGVRGEVVLFRSLEEVNALPENALAGKIALFSRPMKRGGEDGYGYGAASGLRVRGPSAAAKKGAMASMVRSLGTADYRLPHTGMLSYEEGVKKIPAIAIAVEDSLQIERLLDQGATVEVEFEISCETLPDAPSANVIADLKGREKPEEIVLIACHLDTWDVGQGAIDDGSGCVMVMETLRLLKTHNLIPRRTIRGVLFTNEENGLRGGRNYAQTHADNMKNHVAAIESDAGAGTPLGFGVTAGEGGVSLVREIAKHLRVIDADQITEGGGGADISPMRPLGVPQIGLRQDTYYYFDYHHTAADTLDKVDPDDLDRNVAAMAVLAWGLAEMESTLPRLPVENE